MLVTCPECGAKISEEADPCPKCGYPNAGKFSQESEEERQKEIRRRQRQEVKEKERIEKEKKDSGRKERHKRLRGSRP